MKLFGVWFSDQRIRREIPMFDSSKVFLGIAPIGWCNDDMPELGAENTFRQTVSEMALAGLTGCEIEIGRAHV